MARDPLHTEICDILGIEYPVILAGMGGVAGPTIAAAVSNAGGLGVMGLSGNTPEEIRQLIKKCRSLTNKPFGVDILIPSTVPEGGTVEDLRSQIPEEQKAFIKRLMEELKIPEPKKKVTPQPLTADFFRKQIDVVLEERVPVFASGLGNPAWMTEAARQVGTKIIALVGNVKNARRVAEGGADIVVAQGYDAGGHTGRIGTFSLIPQIVDAVYPKPVVGAGGIADGRGLAAALALGAGGVWVGTAFIVSHEASVDSIEMGYESEWHMKVWKDRLVKAVDEDTKVGRMYSGKPMRHLKNAFSDAWDRPGAPPTLGMPLQELVIEDAQAGMMEAGMWELMGDPSGQGAGLIKELRPAKEIMEDMIARARQVLGTLSPQEVPAR